MAQHVWHDANYSHRMAICTPIPSNPADGYYSLTIAAWFDAFWTVVQSTGYDVRFFDAAGTGLTYNRQSWNYAAKSATFHIQNTYGGAADESELRWMYWGYTSAADGDGAVTATNAISFTTAYPPESPERLIVARMEAPGATTPAQRISKATVETVIVWWDVTDALGDSGLTYSGRKASAYQLVSIDWDATAGSGVYLSGARDAALTTISGTLITETADGRLLIGMVVTGGVVNTDYTLVLRLILSRVEPYTGNVPPEMLYDFRALLQVRDPAE